MGKSGRERSYISSMSGEIENSLVGIRGRGGKKGGRGGEVGVRGRLRLQPRQLASSFAYHGCVVCVVNLLPMLQEASCFMGAYL